MNLADGFAWFTEAWMPMSLGWCQDLKLEVSLLEQRAYTPETNITPEIGPSQKEIHLPTTYFQGIFVSFRECFFCRILKRCLAVWWCLHIVLFQCGLFLSLWPPVLSIPIHPFEVTWRNPAEVIMEISMNTLWISKRNLCQFVSENIACQYVNKALPHGGESLDQKKLEKMWFCVHCF